MSLLLARCPARAGQPALAVSLATSQRDLDDLFRLRRQIYVDEMGILRPDHPFVEGDRLRDRFDDYSVNILLRADGQPAGSIRLTEASAGPLEVDLYTDASGRCPDPRRACEVTRLMVRRDLRGSAASALLLYGLWRVLRTRSRYILGAAKPGGLGRYYKQVTAAGVTVHPERFEYGLTGCEYELIVADTGAPLSPRRAAWRAWIHLLAVMAFKAPPAGLEFVRTGRLPARRSPSQPLVGA